MQLTATYVYRNAPGNLSDRERCNQVYGIFNYVATFLGVSAHRFATLALVVILVAHLACESFSFCAQQSGRLMQAIRTNRRVPRAGGCGWRM